MTSYLNKLKIGFKIIGWPVFIGVILYPIFISLIAYFDPLLVVIWIFAYFIIGSFLVGLAVYHNFEKYSKDL